MAKTQEEKFLLKIYEESKDGILLDYFEIGRLLGLHDKRISNVIHVLAQSNLIKKIGSKALSLTTNGQNLAKSLMEG